MATRLPENRSFRAAKYNFASDGSLVVGSGTMGIDVSKWNGKIDWNAVKNSGVSYVIIRVGYRGSSQGALIDDPTFKTNIKGATAAGLKVGVYFFTQAVDEVEAVQEASMVLDRISGYKISYPVFLDVEGSGGRGDKIDSATRTAVCKAFCNTIQNARIHRRCVCQQDLAQPEDGCKCTEWLQDLAGPVCSSTHLHRTL